MFRKILDRGEAGDNVVLLLRGIDKNRYPQRYGNCQARFNYPAHQIQGGGLYPEERRRWSSHAIPQQIPSSVLPPYTDVTGEIHLPEGVEMVMPGDNITITVELINPVAMEKVFVSRFVKVAVR
jgi:elongation factor Tu